MIKMILKKLVFISMLIVTVTLNESVQQANINNNNLVKLSNCKVRLDQDQIIDLTSLDDRSRPRKDTDKKGNVYLFNPCIIHDDVFSSVFSNLMSNSIIIWLHFLFNKGSPIKCNNEKKPTAAVIFSMSRCTN
jgi:hypothetical protein